MDFTKLWNPDVVIPVISGVLGVLLGRISRRTSVLRYTCKITALAVAGDDQHFGSVSVAWRGNPVQNLYSAVVEVENPTLNDFQNVPIRIYGGVGTIILGEYTELVDTPNVLVWSEGFRAQLAVAEGQQPTDAQKNIYNHSREYMAPVLNRGVRARFTYLVTCPGGSDPALYVSVLYPGLTVQKQALPTYTWGVPTHIAALRGTFVTLLVVLACGLLLDSVWLAVVIAAVVGLSASLLGAAVYKSERWLRRVLFG